MFVIEFEGLVSLPVTYCFPHPIHNTLTIISVPASSSTTAYLCTVLYSPLPCSTVHDSMLINRLRTTPIVYMVHFCW
jgi:hypothetical protein